MWIHEHQNWPNFTWSAQAIASKLADVRYRQGRMIGRMENLGFELRREANLTTLTNDVVKSCAIEGEFLKSEDVRSSIARRLGMGEAGLTSSHRDVEGIVEVTLDATQRFSKPLSTERLFAWHSALFPTGFSGLSRITVGSWRTAESGPMQIVSGPIERQKIHFEAPHAQRLENEMTGFFQWFDHSLDVDPVLKSGIAHLWFVTIHPFDDGNGRISRAISDMALARADNVAERFYSLSAQIESERKDYYNQLERQGRSEPQITDWLEWFLDCLARAISAAETTLESIIFKSRLLEKISHRPVNDRQRLILNRMLDEGFEGYITNSKYVRLAKCSSDTALRDIRQLKTYGVLIQNRSAGRSTSYRLPDKIQLLN